jgi:hypothetical protein
MRHERANRGDERGGARSASVRRPFAAFGTSLLGVSRANCYEWAGAWSGQSAKVVVRRHAGLREAALDAEHSRLVFGVT